MKFLKLILGPLAAACLWLFLLPGSKESLMAGVVAWMALWWMTEAVELSITALLPMIFLPSFGILDAEKTAVQYMDPVIFLFIGGFLIAIAIEKWNLHKRIALRILLLFGTKTSGILAGVLFATYCLSMWISNTATVMMLLASVLALISQTENYLPEKSRSGFATALLLGLAFAASIGGMATPVGTPTNMIFYAFYASKFPTEEPVNFASWVMYALPVSFFLLVTTFFTLRFMFLKEGATLSTGKKFFREELQALGKMSGEEKMVSAVFLLTALLWFFRADIELGDFVIPGWSNLFGNPQFIHDGMVAVAAALFLFFLPSEKEKGKALLSADDFRKMPFEIVLLFGGGFAMAAGFEAAGLGKYLSGKIIFSENTSLIMLLTAMCVLIVMMSEFASNVATIQLFLPVLAAVLPQTGAEPLTLLIPATLAASIGFMLPVATAPNTIVYGSRRMKAVHMMRSGFVLDAAGIVFILLLALFFLF